MNGGAKRRGGVTFSVYFVAFLLFAALFPGFRPLTEWIAPPLFIYPINAASMGILLLLFVAVVVVGHAVLSVPALGVLYALDVFVAGRLLRGLSGGRPVLFPSLWSFLKWYVRFAVFACFYGIMGMSLYFGLPEHAALLLFALSVVILGMSFAGKWRGALLAPGWKPVMRAWPLLAAAGFFSGFCAALDAVPSGRAPMIAGVVCLAASLFAAGRRVRGERGASGTIFLNGNALAAMAFLVALAVMGDRFALSARKAPAMREVVQVVETKGVYDVLPDDDGAVFFTTLKDKWAVGKEKGGVLWAARGRFKHLERILNVPGMNAIAVFGHSGYHLFSKDDLRELKKISANQFVDAESSPDGSMIYGVREYDNYLYLISPAHGTLRTYRMGSRLLDPYAILRAGPTTFFVGNWFISPLLLRIDLARDSFSVRKKLLGFFATGMAADRKRNRLYVSRSLFNRIDVLDMDSLEVVGTIPAGVAPREIVYDEKRELLLAPGYYSGRLAVYDAATGEIYLLPSVGSEVRSVKLARGGDKLYFGTSKGVISLDWGSRWKSLLEAAARDGRKFRVEPANAK